MNDYQRFFGDQEVENIIWASDNNTEAYLQRIAFLQLNQMTHLLRYAEKLGQRNHDYSLAINILKTMCTAYKRVLSLDYIEKRELDRLAQTIKITRENLPRPRIEDYKDQILKFEKLMDTSLSNQLKNPFFTDLTFIH